MKRKAIIHIGTTKTGSTSIQNCCNKYRAEIREQGVCYPVSPGEAAHMYLTFKVVDENQAKRKSRDPIFQEAGTKARLEKFDEAFATEMNELPPSIKRVVISDERLSFMVRTPEAIQLLKDKLDPFFDEYTIITYLRRQDSYLASRYSELLRVGLVGEPDHKRENKVRIQEYDFFHLLNMWKNVFGREAMKPRLYERGVDKKFDSVDDFMLACGLDLKIPADDSARKSNPSMNAVGQEILREVGALMLARSKSKNLSGEKWRTISNAVTKALPGKGWLPTRAEAAEFMTRFAGSNERVRRMYFPERKTLFADESSLFPVNPIEISDRERFEAACRVMLDIVSKQTKEEARLARLEAKTAVE